MRQIFSSPRLENVEQMAELLNAAGIETRVTGADTWKRATKRDFSYTDKIGSSGYKWPALLVMQSEDFPKARQVLREHGLLDLTRSVETSYVPTKEAAPVAETPERAAVRARIITSGLTITVAVLIALKLAHIF